MSHSKTSAFQPPEIPFLVCERGTRWRDAARRFVGPFQHAHVAMPGDRSTSSNHPSSDSNDGPTFRVQSIEDPKVRAYISGQRSVVILWELTISEAASKTLSIAQIGVGRPDAMQIVAIENDHRESAESLALRISEFAIAGIVHAPEDLQTLARLIHRRFG